MTTTPLVDKVKVELIGSPIEKGDIPPMQDHLSTALQLAPIIERVHGAHHPELTRVRELTQRLSETADAAETANLFRELRTLTNDFALPHDACEAFTATYKSLEAADRAFRATV